MSGPLTFSPDPPHLGTGAGTAAEQTARPRLVADHVNGGWTDLVAASGALSGTPGTWTPAGAAPPADLAAAQAIFPYEDPLPWLLGSYIVLGDGSEAYWGGQWIAGRAPQPATGALAGSPGTWTPAGSAPPYSADYAYYAQPVPPVTYTQGQYNVAGNGDHIWYDAAGPAWLVGTAPPLPTGATPGTPGAWTPASARQPYNLAETAGIVPTPATAFTTGQYMLLANATSCHWTGAAWLIDPAP